MAFKESNRSLEMTARDIGTSFQLQNVLDGVTDLSLYAHHHEAAGR